uniref:NADH dehydrogenase subunit 4 n=1 Tax=Parascaris univalens TaxID=6257 RepID=A0A915APN3_PARUN
MLHYALSISFVCGQPYVREKLSAFYPFTSILTMSFHSF